jgi:hypothetical protein
MGSKSTVSAPYPFFFQISHFALNVIQNKKENKLEIEETRLVSDILDITGISDLYPIL